MGFELGLRGTHRGSPRQGRNPFTGKAEAHAPLVMNDAELRAALSVLARHGGLDADGGGLLTLANAKIEFSGFDEEGGLVKVIGALACASELLFELATAGELAIWNMSDEDGPATFVTRADVLARARAFDDELGEVALISSPKQLADILEPHQARAMEYTRRVT